MNKRLESMTIHAFRGLRELELEQFGNVNLLVGPNNSGKTSILEALATYSRPLDPAEWLRAVRRRDFRASGQQLTEGLYWMFPRAKQEPLDAELFHGETRITAEGQFPVSEAFASCEEMISYDSVHSEDTSDDEEEDSEDSSSGSSESLGEEQYVTELRLRARVPQSQWQEFDADAEAGSGFITRESDLLDGKLIREVPGKSDPVIPVATVSPFAHRVERLQLSRLTETRIKQGKASLLQVLRIFDSNIDGVEILSRKGGRAEIYVEHRRFGLAPLHSFGDGLRRALTIAMSLTAAAGGNLLIDDIEAGIHVSALGSVFNWLVKSCELLDVQLFATTHSLEAVDAILSAGDELDQKEVVGYHVDALAQKTIARRFGGDLLHRLRFERGLDVRVG